MNQFCYQQALLSVRVCLDYCFLAKYRHPRQVCITINGLQSFIHCSVLDLWFLFVLDLGSEITVQWWFRLIET